MNRRMKGKSLTDEGYAHWGFSFKFNDLRALSGPANRFLNPSLTKEKDFVECSRLAGGTSLGGFAPNTGPSGLGPAPLGAPPDQKTGIPGALPLGLRPHPLSGPKGAAHDPKSRGHSPPARVAASGSRDCDPPEGTEYRLSRRWGVPLLERGAGSRWMGLWTEIGRRLRGAEGMRAAAASCLFLVVGVASANSDLAGRVDWVEDGDTLIAVLEDGAKLTVRLAKIDAPEICHRQHDAQCRRASQPFGAEASAFLRQLVMGRPVRLRCQSAPDRYGRAVCEVWAGALNVNKELVFQGLAWYTPYRDKDGELQAAEFAARLAHRGLWSTSTPMKPVDWRRVCWKEGLCGG